jgi:hypothetical protein
VYKEFVTISSNWRVSAWNCIACGSGGDDGSVVGGVVCCRCVHFVVVLSR